MRGKEEGNKKKNWKLFIRHKWKLHLYNLLKGNI